MARTSTSRNFALRLLSPDERANYRRLGYHCASKCKGEATHETSFDYITGRRGRLSTRRPFVCQTHAEKFAAKHELEMPTEPTPGGQTATQEMVAQFLGGAR